MQTHCVRFFDPSRLKHETLALFWYSMTFSKLPERPLAAQGKKKQAHTITLIAGATFSRAWISWKYANCNLDSKNERDPRVLRHVRVSDDRDPRILRHFRVSNDRKPHILQHFQAFKQQKRVETQRLLHFFYVVLQFYRKQTRNANTLCTFFRPLSTKTLVFSKKCTTLDRNRRQPTATAATAAP